MGTGRYFSRTKHIIKIDIKGFFDNVDHQYLLNNYPIPKKFRNVLQGWLNSPIHFQGGVDANTSGFPQGSVIGPSLANFILNGLEEVVRPEQVTHLDEKKQRFSTSRREHYKPGQSQVRKKLVNRVIRYADDFLIICNEESQVEKVRAKVIRFLKQRGLEINDSKSIYIKWMFGAKVDLLGFTFHYINAPYSSRVTEQRMNFVQNIKGGLYVYPSKESTIKFKKKIKSILTDNLNWSPYRIICALNPIIRRWGNYYRVGALKEFSRLDHYVYYRTYRYIRRKFKKVSAGTLVERYYTGVSTPSGRFWHFHATWNNAPKNLKARKGDIVWLVLLCKRSKPVTPQMFRANSEVLKTSFYIDSKPFEKWSTNMFKLCNIGETSNKWSELYKQQKGICVVCDGSLGYLLEENLEIRHINQVSKWDSSKEGVNKLKNLQLVHKSCHRGIPVEK